MTEATQETELDAELKQLRDFTSEHSVDGTVWLKEKSKGLLPQNSVGWFRAGVGFYNMKKYYAPAIICLYSLRARPEQLQRAASSRKGVSARQ